MTGIISKDIFATALIIPSLIGECYTLKNKMDSFVYSRMIPSFSPLLLEDRVINNIWGSTYLGICFYAQRVYRHQGNRTFHRLCCAFDHIANLAIKTLNTYLIFQLVKKTVNTPVAAVAGCSILALSLYNAKLAYDNLYEIRKDRVD